MLSTFYNDSLVWDLCLNSKLSPHFLGTCLQYYFGDCSLPRDTFLQDEIKKDDGCILKKYKNVHCWNLECS